MNMVFPLHMELAGEQTTFCPLESGVYVNAIAKLFPNGFRFESFVSSWQEEGPTILQKKKPQISTSLGPLLPYGASEKESDRAAIAAAYGLPGLILHK